MQRAVAINLFAKLKKADDEDKTTTKNMAVKSRQIPAGIYGVLFYLQEKTIVLKTEVLYEGTGAKHQCPKESEIPQ
ncbi:hypothetical protein BC343_21105 [Mucilaginibacter pedocola]|uniref:Uncharacterized protein n=1 Tax=Mucilaginibacter pedocola TaxID=1792845 RepID=A0A1S9PKH1_9SPHI|nr:hypothetical protein BC343_21105 [Mucilaginibacter pedocola]